MSCAKIQRGEGGCACVPPTQNAKSATFYFCLAVLGGFLFLALNTLKGYEQSALKAQSLGMVFVLGFLTGLHCIGMCGGFMMSYMRYGKQKQLSELQMHLRYAVSKVFSYAFFGAFFGLLGSLVYFSNSFKSGISLFGGFFLLYLGAKGLGVFAKFKKWRITDYVQRKSEQITNPVSVGLLNGLMISCAPLQALYLVSASLGDPLNGALILGVFGLGTLPIFMFYGVFVGSLNRLRVKWADVITAGILVVFGVLMIQRGIVFSGYMLSRSETLMMKLVENPVLCY